MKSFFAATLFAAASAASQDLRLSDQEIQDLAQQVEQDLDQRFIDFISREEQAETAEEQRDRLAVANAIGAAMRGADEVWSQIPPVTGANEPYLKIVDGVMQNLCAQQGLGYDTTSGQCVAPAQLQKKYHNIKKQLAASKKTMLQDVVVDLDMVALDEQAQKIRDARAAAQELAGQTADTLEPVMTEVFSNWEALSYDTESTGIEASLATMNELANSISINGETIAEAVAQQQKLAKRPKAMQKITVDGQPLRADGQAQNGQRAEDMERLKISFTGPTADEVMEGIQQNGVQKSIDEFNRQLESMQQTIQKLEQQFEQDVESKTEDQRAAMQAQVESAVDTLSREIKASVLDVVNSTVVEVTTDQVMLAQKTTQSSTSSVWTGVSAGFVGALTGACVYGFLNRGKSAGRAEQPLL